MTLQRFNTPLSPRAVHIDYLRLRCGKEGEFLDEIKKQRDEGLVAPFIAFAEWDVVLFIPSDRLYSDQLIGTYTNKSVTTAVAGSSGYYNYIWDHDINRGWDNRIFNLASEAPVNAADVLMLISLRFTDIFRCRYGLGGELLFCDFLKELQKKHPHLELFAVQSVGWNDMTIVLHTSPGNESVLLDALTRIRFATHADLFHNEDNQKLVAAATYSHVLGNLKAYVDTKLSFGTMRPSIRRADLLVRVTPSMEPSIRDAYRKVAWDVSKEHDSSKDERTELGHYNFSADIKWAFDPSMPEDAAVSVIQNLRKEILARLGDMKRISSSFPETTTVISFGENNPLTLTIPQKSTVPLVEEYDRMVNELMDRVPGLLAERASRMTRHRLAVFLGSISAHLADPVRGSIVSHICRFLSTTFETVIERMDRNEKEDLCHVLEYALNQATDGLSQFQHDANSLGLSGRGGYARVIHSIEQWTIDLIEGLGMNFMPLVTFGMQTANTTTAVKHRIDMPFSTAFAPAWWPTLLHEIGHLCWYDIFGWRLDGIDVWRAFNEGGAPPVDGEPEDPREYLSARAIAKEIFPNYLILRVVADGDTKRLDELMLRYELRVAHSNSVSRALRLRAAVHTLLALHRRHFDATPDDILNYFAQPEDVTVDSAIAARLDTIATLWWKGWITLDKEVSGERVLRDAVEDATKVLSGVIAAIGGRGSSSARLNVTLRIPDMKLFKDDSIRVVRSTIRLMAALARDQEVRRSGPPGQADPTFASFGEVLARIDRIRQSTKTLREEWGSTIDNSVRKREVFANVPPATILASLLAGLEADEKHEMPLSLSIILSLWHRNITAAMLEDSDEYHRQLEERRIITPIHKPTHTL